MIVSDWHILAIEVPVAVLCLEFRAGQNFLNNLTYGLSALNLFKRPNQQPANRNDKQTTNYRG
jgi:hypothetical protein